MVFSFTVYQASFIIRFFTHIIPFIATLLYQFIFPDFLNVSLTNSLYFMYGFMLFVDALYLILPLDYLKKSSVILGGFLLDSLFLSSFIFILGVQGLYPSLILAFFTLVAYSIWRSHLSLISYSLWLGFLFVFSLANAGYQSFDERIFISILVYFVLFTYFLTTEILSQLVQNSSREINRLEKNSLFNVSNFSKQLYILKRDNLLVHKLQQALVVLKDLAGKPAYAGHLVGILDFLKRLQAITEKKSWNFQQLDLHQLLNQVLTRLDKHEDRPARLEQVLDLKSSARVQASRPELEEALCEIIINSFQALHTQSKPILELSTKQQAGMLILKIKDNGQGISKREAKEVFEPFFSKRLGLRGIGLTYARYVAESHRGSLEFHSDSEKGSCVTLILPLLIEKNHRKAV